tara:strand:- start:1285 stop:1977 length:693 start_codon:yes stop_codon:yes gene_type:complete
MKNEEIKILVVDDEPDIVEILCYNLSQAKYQVFSASDGLMGFSEAKKHSPHIIILDIMMPNLDGIATCEKLRADEQFKDTIIMVLSARGEDYSYVAAFEAGADDYIIKPIKPRILVSKVKGLLRRLNGKHNPSNIIQFEDLVIDRESYKIILQGEEINLPRKEFELLFLLASKPDKLFKRSKIMESVWGIDVLVGDRTIDVHVRKLREKLGKKYFVTVKGVGYKFKLPKS